MQLSKTAAVLLAACALAGQAGAADATLSEVQVRSGQEASGRRRPLLRPEVAPVESCTLEEALQAGAGNLNEALDRRPGVAVQVECSICNARFVSLNNLPGRYTTLLADGIPLHSAVSQAYGLDSVGLRGLERIDIMRGAGAAMLFPESLAGAVNLVTRRPSRDEAEIEFAAGQHGHRRLDAQTAAAFAGGALTANLHHNRHDGVDGDGNGVSEYTGYRRSLAGLGFFADDFAGFRLKGRIDGIAEKRSGGALGGDYAAIKAADSGNPFDFSRGAHASPDGRGWIVPDGGARAGDLALADGRVLRPYAAAMTPAGRAGLSEVVFTDRWSAYASGERRQGDAVLGLAAGYASHHQDSFYEGNAYIAGQNQGYLGASLKLPLAGGVWTTLVDWRHEDLASRAALPDGSRADGLDNYTFRTVGLGVQAWYGFFGDRLESTANLRIDRHNVYGTQYSPRLNLLWHHDGDRVASRLSLGRGYRSPTSYFEQDHGILETVRVQREARQVETASNAIYTFNLEEGACKLLFNAHYTRLEHLAILDTGASDAAGQAISVLRNAARPVSVRGADLQFGYQFDPRWSGSAALEASRFAFDPGTLAFARPEKRAYFTLAYDGAGLDAFLRATWTAPQDLARFYYRDGQRYHLDGTPKPERSPAFWTVDLRAEYRLGRHLAVFAGVDNLGDFRQGEHDSMLWVDAAGKLDVTQIWGPNRGRFAYGGLRLAY